MRQPALDNHVLEELEALLELHYQQLINPTQEQHKNTIPAFQSYTGV